MTHMDTQFIRPGPSKRTGRLRVNSLFADMCSASHRRDRGLKAFWYLRDFREGYPSFREHYDSFSTESEFVEEVFEGNERGWRRLVSDTGAVGDELRIIRLKRKRQLREHAVRIVKEQGRQQAIPLLEELIYMDNMSQPPMKR